MALTETLVISDEANVTKNFVEIERSGTSAKRIDDAGTLALPTVCVISHNTSGKGQTLTDRHLIQFAKSELDPNGLPLDTVVNVTIAVPRGLTAGVASAEELVGYAINFLIGTNAARVLANVPAILLGES